MATIVEFRSLPHRGESAPGNIKGPAEIVFFPGARYERTEPPGTEKSRQAKPGRDTIEIKS